MKKLKPLSEIAVPVPKPDETYAVQIIGRPFNFEGLKKLIGAADVSKSGDRMVGLAAESEIIREAARTILASLTVRHLYDRPLTNDKGRVDTVMRVSYDIDLDVYATIADMTLGELKDLLMRSSGKEIKHIGRGLTAVTAAALTKLMDAHELVFLPRKIVNSTKARTTIGLPGTLSFRIQPNHPTDDLSAITLLVYTSLSLGMGDCLIGVNPAAGTVGNISTLLHHLDKLRRETGVPTQICVLGHMKQQLSCLENGAPVEILFQSLAGTEATLTEEFDVTVDFLDEAYRIIAENGPLRDIAEQSLYFETGQGSEVTYGKNDGMDMTTCEALCHTLARRYDPFMVNNATGFIGPETHLNDFEVMIANLQDHFMGKLLGLPMGASPSFTLHSTTQLEGQQMATQLLTAAGADFFMDIYLGADRMLSHFVNSGHDNQTLREVHNRKPLPEYLRWAVTKGIFDQDADGEVKRGPNWGNPRIFCTSEAEFQRLHEALPNAPGFENAGPRPVTKVSRILRANQAVGREAVQSELRLEELGDISFRVLATEAETKEAHLIRPELGTKLSAEALSRLAPEYTDVQIVISDGLSAEAIHHNILDILPVLEDGLNGHGFKLGQHVVAPHGRVRLAESIGDALKTRLVILLIGERPGGDALASRSMSAYLALRLADPQVLKEAAAFSGHTDIRYEYSLITNIYNRGLPAVEAGSVIVEKAFQILTHNAAGNRLEGVFQEIVQTGKRCGA